MIEYATNLSIILMAHSARIIHDMGSHGVISIVVYRLNGDMRMEYRSSRYRDITASIFFSRNVSPRYVEDKMIELTVDVAVRSLMKSHEQARAYNNPDQVY